MKETIYCTSKDVRDHDRMPDFLLSHKSDELDIRCIQPRLRKLLRTESLQSERKEFKLKEFLIKSQVLNYRR